MNGEYDGMGLVELLGQIQEIPEPAPVPLTPQTPGWLILGVALLLLLAILVRLALKHRASGAYRRAALAALGDAGDDPAAIAAILRRTALSAYPRAQVAALSGADWLVFLDGTFPGQGFAEGPGRVVATAPYRSVPPDPALTRLARDWIRHYRPARDAA